MTTCRYVEGLGYLTRAHFATCRNDCDGCEPCPERHCTSRKGCTGHLAEGIPKTCPRCIRRVRSNLELIEQLTAFADAVVATADVDDEVTVLAGPAADPVRVSEIRRYVRGHVQTMLEHGTVDDVIALRILGALPEEDPYHPYAVLGRWEMMFREAYSQPTRLKVTLSRSRAYLAGMLDTVAQDQAQDFGLFAREISECRTHLETTLSLMRKPERGAPCPLCPEDLEAEPKVYKPRLVRRYNEGDVTGANDLWLCPKVEEHWWYEADYRLKVGDEHLTHAKAITASQASTIHGVKASIVRVWGSKGYIAKRGTDPQGLTLYDAQQIASRIEQGQGANPAADSS